MRGPQTAHGFARCVPSRYGSCQRRRAPVPRDRRPKRVPARPPERHPPQRVAVPGVLPHGDALPPHRLHARADALRGDGTALQLIRSMVQLEVQPARPSFRRTLLSQHITNEMHLFEAHRYVALNPVRAEHCDDPGGWRWGSYRALAGLEPAPDFLDAEAVHALFGPQRPDAQAAYRALVLSGLEGRGQTPAGSDPSSSGPSAGAIMAESTPLLCLPKGACPASTAPPAG
jgi:hypothetical protein